MQWNLPRCHNGIYCNSNSETPSSLIPFFRTSRASKVKAQTADELQRLKQLSSTSNSPQKIDAQAILSKNSQILSKLTSRKLKYMSNDPMAGSSLSEASQNIQSAEFIRKMQLERDALVKEKYEWLQRITSDNNKLATMLKVRKQYFICF